MGNYAGFSAPAKVLLTAAMWLGRLEIVRTLLLDVYQQMELTEFRRVRSFASYDVTPEWVLHHLMQHEAEHRSQIGALRSRTERILGAAKA